MTQIALFRSASNGECVDTNTAHRVILLERHAMFTIGTQQIVQ
jgi:hypothetical protein